MTRDEERIRGDGRVPAPRGGPARGYLAGSIPAPGWRAPLTTSGQRAGQLDAQRDQTHPVRSDAAGARGRGLCIQGGASRTADPPSGWDDALGRGVSAPALVASGGAGGRAPHRGWWPRLSSPGEQTSEGRQFTLSTGAVPRSPAPPAAPSPARPADASRGRPRGPTPPLRRCQVPWGWKSRPRRRRTRGLTGLQAPEPDGARGGDRRGRRPLSRAWLHLLRVHLLARQAVASPRLVPRNVSLQDGWGPSVVSPPADSGHGAPRGSAGAGGAVP